MHGIELTGKQPAPHPACTLRRKKDESINPQNRWIHLKPVSKPFYLNNCS